MQSKAPVMFISHGSPMWAIEPGKAGVLLSQLQSQFSASKAVLVISPHWQTSGLQLTAVNNPETIHDFGGFPDALYQLQYPAIGNPELAEMVQSHLQQSQFTVALNRSRGLDHGAWVPLMHLLPAAQVPVLQLSLDSRLDPVSLLLLGRVLGELRDQGIAIVTTGGVTHNLFDMAFNNGPPAAYAQRFQYWVREKVASRDTTALSQPHIETKDYQQAHPSSEHYLPLLVAMGASSWQDSFRVLESPILYRAISMESYLWC
ncbi:DODA-type extradiol aromatic ring-opening family dioxygenase [Amphritea balenae]|uniref:Dioxygenase n=1 Tax=Amphritea balenae TaxID=452629 RepID=A0A3P1SSC8_9GAMM|nr:class III extradiol ring-cleavage dioxygenase [Amphritea balenae]RRD00097.1 dioxygenase [Amphritea balenae]GGK76584.1 dioxygenase [Amphritea balenae]